MTNMSPESLSMYMTSMPDPGKSGGPPGLAARSNVYSNCTSLTVGEMTKPRSSWNTDCPEPVV